MSVLSDKQRQILTKIYYNSTGRAGAFSTLIPLWRSARKIDKSITQAQVKEFLKSNASYLHHKKTVYRHPRRSILTLYPNHIWAADLGFYIADKSVANLQNTLFVSCLDTFSHFAYCRAAPKKTAEVILDRFKDILSQAKTVPRFLFVDRGMIRGREGGEERL